MGFSSRSRSFHHLGSSLKQGPFKGPCVTRVPYYNGDLEREPNLESYLYWVSLMYRLQFLSVTLQGPSKALSIYYMETLYSLLLPRRSVASLCAAACCYVGGSFWASILGGRND